MNKEDLKKYEDHALSDKEILKLVDNKANLVLYPDLVNYESIDELLYPYNACIILYLSQDNFGHWCCLTKKNNKIEFFDPYGGFVDDQLKFIKDSYRKKSNQKYPEMSRLMIESPYDLSFNEHKFQKYGKGINTCGRHCAVRINYKNLDLDEYNNFINEYKKKTGLNPDEIVTILTEKLNNM